MEKYILGFDYERIEEFINEMKNSFDCFLGTDFSAGILKVQFSREFTEEEKGAFSQILTEFKV